MRNLSSTFTAALTARVVQPAILFQLQFVTATVYAWTGIGALSYGGNTYEGVGNFAGMGTVSEGTTVEALGTTLSLSGVDPTLYADSIADIHSGYPATVTLALMAGATVIDTAVLFSGLMDKTSVSEDGDNIKINLALESRLSALQGANRRLWTDIEQRRDYPSDSGFSFVGILTDISNRWG